MHWQVLKSLVPSMWPPCPHTENESAQSKVVLISLRVQYRAEHEGHLGVILLWLYLDLRAPSTPKCITCILHKINWGPVVHYQVGETILLVVVTPNSKCYCSAKHKCSSVTSYLFLPKWLHISHIQCNLNHKKQSCPSVFFLTAGTALFCGLWSIVRGATGNFLVLFLWFRTQSLGKT